jgi:hypothetical protein
MRTLEAARQPVAALKIDSRRAGKPLLTSMRSNWNEGGCCCVRWSVVKPRQLAGGMLGEGENKKIWRFLCGAKSENFEDVQLKDEEQIQVVWVQ